MTLYNQSLHVERYLFLNVLNLSKSIAILLIQSLCQFVRVEIASIVGELQFPIVKADGQLDIFFQFDEVSHLRHKHDPKIQLPLLFLGY